LFSAAKLAEIRTEAEKQKKFSSGLPRGRLGKKAERGGVQRNSGGFRRGRDKTWWAREESAPGKALGHFVFWDRGAQGGGAGAKSSKKRPFRRFFRLARAGLGPREKRQGSRSAGPGGTGGPELAGFGRGRFRGRRGPKDKFPRRVFLTRHSPSFRGHATTRGKADLKKLPTARGLSAGGEPKVGRSGGGAGTAEKQTRARGASAPPRGFREEGGRGVPGSDPPKAFRGGRTNPRKIYSGGRRISPGAAAAKRKGGEFPPRGRPSRHPPNQVSRRPGIEKKSSSGSRGKRGRCSTGLFFPGPIPRLGKLYAGPPSTGERRKLSGGGACTNFPHFSSAPVD